MWSGNIFFVSTLWDVLLSRVDESCIQQADEDATVINTFKVELLRNGELEYSIVRFGIRSKAVKSKCKCIAR